MTESTSWQPPVSPAPDRGSPAPQSGYGPPTTPAWTPPPRPGLIPLRPLTLGMILAATFQVLRRNPRPTLGFALAITGLITIASILTVGLVAFFAFSRTMNAAEADADALAAGAVALVALSTLIPIALGIVGNAILQGIVSLEVARGTVGEKLRLKGLWAAARGRFGALIGWSLLVTVAVLVALLIVVVIVALLIAIGGPIGLVVGVLLAIGAGLGAAVLFAWLATKLALVPSALMIERLSLPQAIARSWSLTADHFWRTFGVLLLVWFILQFVASIVTAPLQLLFSFSTVLFNPNSDLNAMIVTMIVIYVLTIVVSIAVGAISAVIAAATPALLYLDLRMRKEGLDLELTRFVEARQAGDASVADPYLARTAAVGASPWS